MNFVYYSKKHEIDQAFDDSIIRDYMKIYNNKLVFISKGTDRLRIKSKYSNEKCSLMKTYDHQQEIDKVLKQFENLMQKKGNPNSIKGNSSLTPHLKEHTKSTGNHNDNYSAHAPGIMITKLPPTNSTRTIQAKLHKDSIEKWKQMNQSRNSKSLLELRNTFALCNQSHQKKKKSTEKLSSRGVITNLSKKRSILNQKTLKLRSYFIDEGDRLDLHDSNAHYEYLKKKYNFYSPDESVFDKIKYKLFKRNTSLLKESSPKLSRYSIELLKRKRIDKE